MKQIRVFAPGSVANVGSGFDIFGFALDTPGDELLVSLTSTSSVVIKSILGDQGKLPLDPKKNTAGISALKLLEHLGTKQGVEIVLHKKIPLGSGLGSSSASAIGSVYAINQLLGCPLKSEELLPFALEGEFVACGAAHADNVAPALLGGFILVRSYHPLEIESVPCPLELYCTLLHPHLEVLTATARKLVKKEITLEQHVAQTGNASGLILGLTQANPTLIGKSIQDFIAEPYRKHMVPGFDKMKDAALKQGALGCSLSGSGPTLFALSLSHHDAEMIGNAMKEACPLSCDVYLSKINREGPKIL